MKRFYSILLALCVSSMLSAQLSIWDGTDDVWTKGAGTESSPYLIESAQQLAFIASMVNGGVTTYENTYFKLMTNIDLNNLTWVPIGESFTKCFKGHFDGDNKTIKNSQTTLFGYINSATIMRLNIELLGCVINAINSNISHCKSLLDFTITSRNSIGGIVDNASNCNISTCRCTIKDPNRASATASYWKPYVYQLGGIIAVADNCRITNCYVDGRYNHILPGQYGNRNSGGIVGYCTSSTISFSSNKCSLTSSISSGDSNDKISQKMAGGIVGAGDGETQIISCMGLDSVCTAPIEVYTGHHGATNLCGGLCGIAPYSTSNILIKNCFTTMSKAYYDYLTKGTILLNNTYTTTDKTTAAMKSTSFPIILNTDSTVFIKDVTPNVNDGYPIYVDQVYSVTDTLSTIGFTTAQLLGHFYALNADSVGFEYKEASDNTHWYQSVIGQVSGNVVTYNLNNLIVGTNYIYRLWVERDGVRYFGDVLSFTTLECSKAITPITASICQGEEYAFNGQQLKQSGAYRDTLVASNGCDSIIELTLTVMPTTNIEKYDTIMVGESYDYYGDILTESGDYEHYIPMVNKCNLVILHLHVQSSATRVEDIEDYLIPHKIIRDNQVFIKRGDKIYTIMGIEL